MLILIEVSELSPVTTLQLPSLPDLGVMVIKLLPGPISSQPWQREGGGLLHTFDLERMKIEVVHPQISVATLMITWLSEHETFLIFLEFPLEF